MGIDYTFNIAMGFRVMREEVEEIFGQRTAQVSHVEKRFDPKTGERLEDVTVVDRPSELKLIWDSKEYEDCESLLEAVFGTLGAQVNLEGSSWTDDERYIIGPRLATTGDREDVDSHITLGADVAPNDMLSAISVLPLIERFMKRLGFDTSEGPTITIASWVS